MNSTDAKTFYPHGLRPWDWDWDWEEPTGITLALPMLSLFGHMSGSAPHQAGEPEGPRSLQLARHTGHDTTWAVKRIRNCPGSEFARTQTVNSTDAKTFYPHGLRPWDWEWEEPAWHHARFAIVMPCREKAAGLRPAPRLKIKIKPQTPSAGSAHQRHDTTWEVKRIRNWGLRICPYPNLEFN